MPVQRGQVYDLGRIGYVADNEPVKLVPNAWSFMQNMRCEDGSVTPFLGHEQTDTITPTPDTIEVVKTATEKYLVYAGGTTIYSWRDGDETLIGSGYSSGGFDWQSDVLGGVAIFTNGVSNPVYWGGSGSAEKLPFDTTDETSTCFWDDPEIQLSARIIREFKYHLFALDVTDCNGRDPRKIRWSHPAEPGSLPITWDIANGLYDAGQAILSRTTGRILDARVLRDTLQVYLDDAVYQITYTGDRGAVAQQLFNIRLVSDTKGIYASNCVADIGGIHFVVGDKQIYLYDGNSFKPIADERVKNLFFDGVSRSNKDRTFVTYYERLGEVWLCYPSSNSVYCDLCLIYNKDDDTWSQRNLPDVTTATYALLQRSSGYTWATLPGAWTAWTDWGSAPEADWDTWTQPIDSFSLNDSLLMTGSAKLFEMDRTNQAAGVNVEAIARRTHLDTGDTSDWHSILSIYPRAEGDSFNVRLGYHENINDAVNWTAYQAFDPDTDYKLDFRVNGRLHAIEFQSEADVSYRIDGYEFDYSFTSKR